MPRQRPSRWAIENIEYTQADILELGSLDKRFDIISSSGVLHSLAEPEHFWLEFSRQAEAGLRAREIFESDNPDTFAGMMSFRSRSDRDKLIHAFPSDATEQKRTWCERLPAMTAMSHYGPRFLKLICRSSLGEERKLCKSIYEMVLA